MAVQIQGGITIGPGIIIGDVFAVPALFVTEIVPVILETETGVDLTTEEY
jgi:hypothetical protein